jgi:hypothetical protein
MPACGNLGCDVPGAWQHATESIEIPEYPGCVILVEYCWRTCSTNPQSVQVYVNYIQQAFWQICCPQCADLADIISGNDGSENLKKLFLKIWEQVTLKLYEETVQYAIDNSIPLSSLYCPNNKVEYTTTEESCSAFCTTQIPDGPNLLYKTTKVTCAPNECCLYSRQYCIDPVTEEIVVGPTYLTETGEDIHGVSCNSSIIPDWPPSCFEGTNSIFLDCEGGCVQPPFTFE